MKRTFNHLKGFSILEQAIAIPVIVFFALGAVDITNYFKAKSALQEGVKKTLRCLTPLDGECNVYTPPQTVPAYNIYTSSVTPTWPDKIYDFNGTAQWASAVEKVLIPEATILKDVTYPLKKYPRTVNYQTYSYRANYLVMPAYLPFVDSGLGTKEDPKSVEPDFLFLGTKTEYPKSDLITNIKYTYKGQVYSGNNGYINLKNVTLHDGPFDDKERYPRTLEVEFTVANLNVGKCYGSTNLELENGDNNSPNFRDSCFDGGRIPFIIHVKGNKPANHKDDVGDVNLSLSGSDFFVKGRYNRQAESQEFDANRIGTASLGGREYDERNGSYSAASFVPRGVNLSRSFRPVSGKKIEHKYIENYQRDEYERYQDIRLAPGNTYKLKITVENDEDRHGLTWLGESIGFFSPILLPRTDNVVCSTEAAYNSSMKKYSCSSNTQVAGQTLPNAITTSLDRIENPVETKFVGCVKKDETKELGVCVTNDSSCGQLPNYDPNFHTNNCLSDFSSTMLLICPANKGIVGEPNNNTDSYVQCPITDLEWNKDGTETFTEKSYPFSASEIVRDQYTPDMRCQDKLPHANKISTNVGSYKKVTWKEDSPATVQNQLIYTGLVKPVDYLTSNLTSAKGYLSSGNDFYCNVGSPAVRQNRFKVEAPVSYNEQHPLIVQALQNVNRNQQQVAIINSKFNGNYSMAAFNSCSGWEAELRQEAITLFGLNESSYFEAQKNFVGEPRYGAKPNYGCYEGVAEYVKTDLVGEAQLPGTYTADAFPVECKEPGVSCRMELAGYTKIEENHTLDSNKAISSGVSMINATLPKAKLCDSTESPNCLVLSSEADSNYNFNVAAEYNLPLAILLGHGNLKVSYNDQQVWERKFLTDN